MPSADGARDVVLFLQPWFGSSCCLFLTQSLQNFYAIDLKFEILHLGFSWNMKCPGHLFPLYRSQSHTYNICDDIRITISKWVAWQWVCAVLHWLALLTIFRPQLSLPDNTWKVQWYSFIHILPELWICSFTVLFNPPSLITRIISDWTELHSGDFINQRGKSKLKICSNNNKIGSMKCALSRNS